MNKSTLLRVLVFGLLACFVAAAAFGKGRSSSHHTPAPTPHDIVISSVAANSVTVTDEKSTKTVTVTQFTEITVNGQKATIADLKPGMTVNLGLKSPTEASRITAITKK